MDSYDEYIDSIMIQDLALTNNVVSYVYAAPSNDIITPPSTTSTTLTTLNGGYDLNARKQVVQTNAMREYILLAAALGVVAYFVIKNNLF